MLDDDEILQQASKHIKEFQEHARVTWLDQMKEAFAVREGLQWLKDEYDRVLNDGLTPYSLNLTGPILNSVIGFQVQNRSEVSYVPRLIGEDAEEAERYAGMAENGVNWIEDTSQAQFHDSAAFADMVTCGIGATDSSVDYNHNEFGLPLKERIFPGFLMWDPAASQKNILDANWCGRAKVVSDETLAAEEEDDNSTTETSATFDDSYFLDWFDTITTVGLSVMYEYYWRQKEYVYIIRNPFLGHVSDPLVMTWLAEASQRLGFDLKAAFISLGKDEFRDFKKEMGALGIPFEKIDRKSVWRYYRATIWGGKVRKKALNFSQSGFSLKFMTGNFSETDRCFYGMIRDLRDPQRLLNQAVTDIAGYFRSIPKGGVFIEAEGAVDDIDGFIQTYGKARDVTVVNKDALAQNRILPKTPPNPPPGLLEAAGTYADLMLRVAGVTQEFMGAINTKDISGVLHAQLVQQGLTVLSPYFDAMKFYIHTTGQLYIDLLRILAQNQPERAIRTVTGETQYIALLEDDIAAEYDIEIEDTPLTPTQRQETFKTLMTASQAFLPTNPQLAAATAGVALGYSDLQADEIDQIKQAATPLPPPPNPLEQELVQAETEAKIAEAGQKKADAYKKTIEAASIIKNELRGTPPDAAAPANPDPMAVIESAHAASMEQKSHDLKSDQAKVETLRAAADDERKNRELDLKERELNLKQMDIEHTSRLERAKLRTENPGAAAALDAEDARETGLKETEARLEALRKEGDARAESIRAEGGASRKATTDMVTALTGTLDKVLREQSAQTKTVSKAVDGLGKEVAKAVAGMAKAVDRMTAAQEQTVRTVGKMDDGLGELAAAVAQSKKPRKKKVRIARSDGSTIEATMEG
jgi:hypothetical protein